MDGGGRLWTPVDSKPLCTGHVWTAVDVCGLGLSIYGSEGWGFESLRACCWKPLRVGSRSRRWWAARTGKHVWELHASVARLSAPWLHIHKASRTTRDGGSHSWTAVYPVQSLSAACEVTAACGAEHVNHGRRQRRLINEHVQMCGACSEVPATCASRHGRAARAALHCR